MAQNFYGMANLSRTFSYWLKDRNLFCGPETETSKVELGEVENVTRFVLHYSYCDDLCGKSLQTDASRSKSRNVLVSHDDKMRRVLSSNVGTKASFVFEAWKKTISRVYLFNIVCNLCHFYGFWCFSRFLFFFNQTFFVVIQASSLSVWFWCLISPHYQITKKSNHFAYKINKTLKNILVLFQDTWSQPQGYPLQRPLTALEPEDARTALEIYKLVNDMDCIWLF